MGRHQLVTETWGRRSGPEDMVRRGDHIALLDEVVFPRFEDAVVDVTRITRAELLVLLPLVTSNQASSIDVDALLRERHEGLPAQTFDGNKRWDGKAIALVVRVRQDLPREEARRLALARDLDLLEAVLLEWIPEEEGGS